MTSDWLFSVSTAAGIHVYAMSVVRINWKCGKVNS